MIPRVPASPCSENYFSSDGEAESVIQAVCSLLSQPSSLSPLASLPISATDPASVSRTHSSLEDPSTSSVPSSIPATVERANLSPTATVDCEASSSLVPSSLPPDHPSTVVTTDPTTPEC